MTNGSLVERLRGIVGSEHVVTHERQLATYASDGLLQYAVEPAAVVLPGIADEVAAVVRACHEAGVPWVARGAGSGLSGGALPVEEGVLIALSRLRRILEVDIPNGRVLVEPGVTNIAVSQAVAPTHFFPPDPSSQIVCTIGGNVAENSGGAHCFKYGFTTNYVTGLEVVLPGRLRGHARRAGARPPGLRPGRRVRRLRGHARDRDEDLAARGAEAGGGAHARGLLRLDRRRPARWCRGSSPRGSCPGAIEMMDNLSIRAAEGATNAGYPVDAGAALVVELDGSEAECETRFEHVKRAVRGGADSVRVAQDEAERELIWRARKAAFAAMGRIAPNYYVQDSVIPRTRLAEVLGQIERARGRARAPGGERLPRRRRQPAPARLLRRRAARARPSAPRSWPG